MPSLWRLPTKAKEQIWAACKYEPSPEQQEFHNTQVRIKLVSGGERGGKSYCTSMEGLTWIFQEPAGLGWIVGPDYQQTHAEFDYLTEYLPIIGLINTDSISRPQDGQWAFSTPFGGRVMTRTSAEVMKLASEAPDWIMMVESGQQTEEAFLKLRGRASQHRAPIIMSGTFERGLGWYTELWNRWQVENTEDARSFSLPSWSNLAVYPGGRDDPEIKALEAIFPHEEFMERFGAIPAPPSTVVLKEFRAKTHITTDAEYEPGERVQLWIDPGFAHAYAVLAMQFRGENVYQIDEVYETGMTAREIIGQCRQRPWWGDVKSPCVMDVAGRTHPGTDSQMEIWLNEAKLWMIAERIPIVDGILRHRTFLKDPATGEPRLFHHPRCKGTIAEYAKYQYRRESIRQSATEVPIDRDNDAMKALAYGLVANFGYVKRDDILSRFKVEVRKA